MKVADAESPCASVATTEYGPTAIPPGAESIVVGRFPVTELVTVVVLPSNVIVTSELLAKPDPVRLIVVGSCK